MEWNGTELKKGLKSNLKRWKRMNEMNEVNGMKERNGVDRLIN